MVDEYSLEELTALAEKLPSEEDVLEHVRSVGSSEKDNEPGMSMKRAVEQEFSSQGKEKEKKKETNARNCRKYREKRRLEEQKVYKDNLALKRERIEFQEKIAKLETEVQALRGQGVVDLSKENELLRIEVEKHKRYIEEVVRVTKETPLHVENEEEQRLMKSGIESATAHIVGIMYSSVCDPSWKTTTSFEVMDGIICTCRYQLLPTNCRFEDATRVNLRMDSAQLPFAAEQLVEHIVKKSGNMDDWALRHKDTPWAMYRDTILENVHPKVKCDEDNFVSCIRVAAPKEKPEREAIFVHATKDVDLYSTAFLRQDSEGESANAHLSKHRCKVLVGTTSDIKIQVSEKLGFLERAFKFESEGLVVRSFGPNSCSWTHVMTTPVDINDETSKIIHEIPITEQGDLKQGYIDIWRENAVWFIQSQAEEKFSSEQGEIE